MQPCRPLWLLLLLQPALQRPQQLLPQQPPQQPQQPQHRRRSPPQVQVPTSLTAVLWRSRWPAGKAPPSLTRTAWFGV